MRCLITSNGFMNASLAIVAHAPLVAADANQSLALPLQFCGTYRLRQGGVLLRCRPLLASQLRMLRNIQHVPVLEGCQIAAVCSVSLLFSPAPSTTLETPLHNDMYPSALDMVEIALPMPV
jgi:hypothetical protein